MVDSLPKIVGFSTHLALLVKSWLVQDQTVLALATPGKTATGKESSNPFIAGSLRKTISPMIHLSQKPIRVFPGILLGIKELLQDNAAEALLRVLIESYIQLQDYTLWEIIEEGNSFKPVARTTTNEDGTSTTTIPGAVTAEQKILKKNDLKARSILMMTLPSENLLTFNKHKDA
ncbi:hypothetical protein Tco_1425826 [Tanacetum coccineum]